MPLVGARNAKDVLLDTRNLEPGRRRGWNEKQEKHTRLVSNLRESASMLWKRLTFGFWRKMVAVATVLADWGHWCLKEVVWVFERQVSARAMVTVVAMAMVIACDAVRMMENAKETL